MKVIGLFVKTSASDSDKGLPALVCDLCQTYVATAKPDANAFGVSAAFALAATTHTRVYHKNLPADEVTFSYGMRIKTDV